MSLLVADCPRCGASQMTFDVLAQVFRRQIYNWQNWYEIFCSCRNCQKPSVFIVGLKTYDLAKLFDLENGLVKFGDTLNPHFQIEGYVSLRENVSHKAPEHVPENISDAFNEGTACLAIKCCNAAACMFRLCVDLATRPLLDVEKAKQPNEKQRRDLGLRLAWLFQNGLLTENLKELAKCIREDANDGAHVGDLAKQEADDLLDFTETLLERLYTEPEKLRLAEERRQTRRANKKAP